jgi:hypothetical protein
MRNGGSTSFPIDVSSVEKGDVIGVSIYDSREFIVTRNQSIVYSHRYVTPVFFADPTDPIKVVNSNSALYITIVPNSIMLSVSSTPWFVLVAKVFSIVGIFASFAFLVKYVLGLYFKQENRKIDKAIPTSLISFFWVTCLAGWLLKARDDTGSSNPSPFAQVGPAFSDIMQIFQAGKFSTPYDYGAVNYPSTALYMIRLFGPVSVGAAALIVLAFSFGVLLWLISGLSFSKKRYLNRYQTFLIALAYPATFALFRGNLDLLVVALIGMSLDFYLFRGYKKTAIAILSIAAAIKFWPIVFVLFLLKKRDFLGSIFYLLGSLAITLVSAYLLGYHRVSDEIHIVWNTLGLFNGTPSINTYNYSFSLGGLLLAMSIFLGSHFSLHPSALNILQGLQFVKSKEYLLILGISVLLILFLIWKSKRNDSILLYCSALALLESSISYAYRATILIVCLILRMNESGSVVRLKDSNVRVVLKKYLLKFLRIVELISWSCILAPTTFHYFQGSLFSTSSVFQPTALICIVAIEWFFERDYQRGILRSNRGLSKTKSSPTSTPNLRKK